MKILIVGGGSAGWMTAATLESQFPNYKISLIESKTISTVGVGESTIGQIVDWMRLLKIEDKDFIKHVDGSYKLSIKFTDFYKKGESFHYPFGEPHLKGNRLENNDWWFKKILYPKTPYSDYADCINPLQMAYVNQNKFDINEVAKAYHFDATKFGSWLKNNYCKKIKHIIEDVVSVEQDENGIKSLNNKHKADLYIDCTGFKSLLLDKTLKEPFESYSDILPNDSAWATKIPYKNKEKQLEPFTNCTAIENGWVWNIPLWSRIGTGYVYSSKFVDDETALKEFKNHLGQEDLEFKNIKMRVGIHNRLWVKNVVAIGLSAGFIEPLESNGLFSVHEFLMKLVRNLQREKTSQWDKDNFNYQCKHLFREFAEFVALHYALSHRNDTEYWKNCFNKSWDETLINLKPIALTGFKQAVYDKTYNFKFNCHGGLHFIAAGMHWGPTDKLSLIKNGGFKEKDLDKEFEECINNLNKKKEICKKLVKNKPSLFSVLENIHNNKKKE
jgi:flavin-dependent dehydrogenase